MAYVDALLDKTTDQVHVVERDEHGHRIYRNYPAEYVLYYDDPNGKHQTIYRTRVTRVATNSSKTFRKEVKMNEHKRLWEHDCNVVFRCLENNYLGQNAPKLHTAFWDIESDWAHPEAPADMAVIIKSIDDPDSDQVNTTVRALRQMTKAEHKELLVFDPRLKGWLTVDKSTLLRSGHSEVGFAPTTDPFNPITAISVYLDWQDLMVTLAVPPKTMSMETAEKIAEEFDNTIIFETEAEMLNAFLDLIGDADVLSGWNSEGYDIPYTVGRIIRVLGKSELRRLCLWDQTPKKREFARFGTTSITYDLVGRVHLDYMQLYRKFTYEERHSYSLDSIGEYELDEKKVAYDGSLDQLYNQDFYKFIAYNRQDVALLAKLDKKLKFLDLANQIAHENTVLLQTTMGAVAVTDQALINEAHRLELIVPSRKGNYTVAPTEFDNPDIDDDDDEDEDENSGQAAGAYVAAPKVGMHRDIGAIDINSLYPSTIRALNMSPETIVGQLRPIMTDLHVAEKKADKYVGGRKYKGSNFAGAWDGLFGTLEYTAVMNKEHNTEITIDWEDGNTTIHRADEVWSIVFEGPQKWMLSANGTIFHYDTEGLIPGLLARWYSERKILQKKLTAVAELSTGIEMPDELAAEVRQMLERNE